MRTGQRRAPKRAAAQFLSALTLGAALAACEIVRVQPSEGNATRSMDTIVARLGDRACGLTGRSVVSGEGIGSLRIGASIEGIRDDCRILGESAIGVGDYRFLLVDLFRDTAAVVADAGRITRIELAHSPFRTADSLGVGRHLTRLLQIPNIDARTIGGRLYAVSPAHCGLAFELIDPAPAPPAPQSGPAALRRLPGETTVERVVITGCGTRPSS